MMISELQELRNVFHGLETMYSTYLPKVDPILLNDPYYVRKKSLNVHHFTW